MLLIINDALLSLVSWVESPLNFYFENWIAIYNSKFRGSLVSENEIKEDNGLLTINIDLLILIIKNYASSMKYLILSHSHLNPWNPLSNNKKFFKKPPTFPRKSYWHHKWSGLRRLYHLPTYPVPLPANSIPVILLNDRVIYRADELDGCKIGARDKEGER